MVCLQQTAPAQQHRSKDTTAHPHQPGASPEPPHPDPAHSSHHHPDKAKVKFPIQWGDSTWLRGENQLYQNSHTVKMAACHLSPVEMGNVSLKLLDQDEDTTTKVIKDCTHVANLQDQHGISTGRSLCYPHQAKSISLH
jgi:hypothetical protein